MSKERHEKSQPGKLVTNIHLDLPTRSVTFRAGDEVVAALSLAPEGLIFQTGSSHEPLSVFESASARTEQEAGEKEKPQTLQGRLKSKPRPGRPDRNQQPTAWARFAAHVEGQDCAVLYSTTFHRHTASIALELEKDAAITVQGYPHAADDPASTRLHTLSVINLLDYPDKQSQ